MMHGDSMAEDVVQQTVLKALLHAREFRFEASIRNWLVAIAVNEVRGVYRSGWHSRSVPLTAESVDKRRWAHPGETYEVEQRNSLVRDAVSRLPEGYRSVIELCDLGYLSARDAAPMLGLTVAAVKIRHHRGRRRLERILVSRGWRSHDRQPKFDLQSSARS